jgi:transcription-repair coupling factor (superfamily II helicase)
LLSLAENPVVVLDEPEQIAAAAERLWKRLDDPRPFPCPPGQNFYAWPELAATFETKASLTLRELDLDVDPTTHLPAESSHSRPSLAFHGNVQAAVAEARNLVEQGYRVVFFAQSTGELERLADIFQEYAVPFQLGLDPADATRPYRDGQHAVGQGFGAARRRLSGTAHCRVRLRRSLRS